VNIDNIVSDKLWNKEFYNWIGRLFGDKKGRATSLVAV